MNNSFDVRGINLPDDIKLKLESLEKVNLTSTTSKIYLDYEQDLELNLDKIFNLQSTVSYINLALDRIIIEVFGNHKIKISVPKYSIYQKAQGFEVSFISLLNNQEIELIFGEQNTLKYKLPNDFIFSSLTNTVPIINDLKLSNPELILTNISYNFTHSKLGYINLSRGVNFIGDINFKNLQTNFSNFIHQSKDTRTYYHV